MTVKIFSIIKGHSERIPKKNFEILGGKPVWRWLVDELDPLPLYINTDCAELLVESGIPHHVQLIERDQIHIDWEEDPNEEKSPVLEMVRSFINQFVDDEGEVVVLTHVTSPFLKKETVLKAVKLLEEGWGSVHSVEVIQDFVWMASDGRVPSPVNFDPTFVQRTQDLSQLLVSKGAFFVFRARDFLVSGTRLVEPILHFPLSRIEAIDLDTPDDLALARAVARGLVG